LGRQETEMIGSYGYEIEEEGHFKVGLENQE
jgi:hypothetical protein